MGKRYVVKANQKNKSRVNVKPLKKKHSEDLSEEMLPENVAPVSEERKELPKKDVRFDTNPDYQLESKDSAPAANYDNPSPSKTPSKSLSPSKIQPSAQSTPFPQKSEDDEEDNEDLGLVDEIAKSVVISKEQFSKLTKERASEKAQTDLQKSVSIAKQKYIEDRLSQVFKGDEGSKVKFQNFIHSH